MKRSSSCYPAFDPSQYVNDPVMAAVVNRLLSTSFRVISRDTGLRSIARMLPYHAMVIQTTWKRYITRKKYLKTLKAVVLAQSLLRSKIAKRRTNILRALNEVYQTEKKYFKMLTWLIQNYETPMRVANIIPIDDADVLFGCVRPLLLAHQQIVIDLEIARLNLDAFFRVGVRLVDLLPLYSDYTANYSKALDVYSRLVTDQKFSSYCILRQERSKANCNDDQAALDLRSLLITPIQRPPRYVMLLHQILKYIPMWKPERVKLLQLTKAFEVFTDTLNSKASISLQPIQMLQAHAKDLFSDERKLVRAGEVGFYDTSISGRVRSLLTTSSKFARGSVVVNKEAIAGAESDTGFPMHTLFLFSDMLVVMREQAQAQSTSSRSSEGAVASSRAKVRLETCAKILLKDIKRVDTPEADSTVFVVAMGSGHGKLSFSCATTEERRKWVRAFETVMPLPGAHVRDRSRTLRNAAEHSSDPEDERWSDVFVLKRDKKSVIATWMESKKVRRLTIRRGELKLCKNKTTEWVKCDVLHCEVVRVHKRPECLMLNIGAACVSQPQQPAPSSSSYISGTVPHSRSLLIQFCNETDCMRWYTRIQQAQVEALLSSVPASKVDSFAVQVSGGSRICRPALVPRDAPPSSTASSFSTLDPTSSSYDNASSGSSSGLSASSSSHHSRSPSTASPNMAGSGGRITRRQRSFSEPKLDIPSAARAPEAEAPLTPRDKLHTLRTMRRFHSKKEKEEKKREDKEATYSPKPEPSANA